MLKSLKKYLRNITCISLLLACNGYSQYVFTPFADESSYKGVWNLSIEIPNYIAAYLREFYKVNVLSSTAFLSLAEKNEIDAKNNPDIQTFSNVVKEIGFNYLVTGAVNDFSVSRFSAGESNIAGYEAYRCDIEIRFQIYDITTNSNVFAKNLESSVTSKGMAFNLFGAASDDKKQYLALDKIVFGSEEFHKTIVGEAMLQLCKDLTDDMKSTNKELLYPKREIQKQVTYEDKSLDQVKLKTEIIKGQILTYDSSSGEAFVNLGAAHGLTIGSELSIYAQADSLFDPVSNEFLGLSDKIISSLEIIELRGDKLSLAIVKESRDKVQKGMEVRKLVLKTKE